MSHDFARLAPSVSKNSVTIKELTAFEEYQECVQIQRETWGDEFEEWVPTSILKVSQKIGGIVAGAYDTSGRMVGFVYGLTGYKDGVPVHWSHMLAVRNDARGLGLGKQLKLYQRELLLTRGIKVVYWTYDPLVARNANLNLNALGAVVNEYVKDMYIESGSILHRGMSMDRFIVAWHLESSRVTNALAHKSVFDSSIYSHAPIVNTKVEGESILPVDQELMEGERLRIEIPSDIEVMNNESKARANEWRLNTRRAFLWYQERGYTVDGFVTDPQTGRCYYCLTRQRLASH
jgi:predicted GNAT superfamily acetyltransferase